MAADPIVNTPHQKNALRRAAELMAPFIARIDPDDYQNLVVRVQEAMLRAYERGITRRGL